MDILTSRETAGCERIWDRAPNVAQGIGHALAAGVGLLLYSADTSRDSEETRAALELYRSAGGPAEQSAVAAVHPSADWVELLRAIGVNHIFLARQCLAPCDTAVTRGDLREIGEAVCPYLHARHIGGGPLSVCGMRFDRLVLGDREFSRWCLADWQACPHVRAAPSRATPMRARATA
jgi:hypothetical protein